ncbi:MAG: hypothetical protein ACRDRN_26430, partial [Sciscionella sp.]
FHPNGGSDDITPLRRAGNGFLNGLTNVLFGTEFSDLCYGYNAFWRDIIPLLQLPPVDATPSPGRMPWGDGFEIETVLNCRVATAGLRIAEVPSVERQRIFGETNLKTFTDGWRVLRTILAEWQRMVASRQVLSRGHLNRSGSSQASGTILALGDVLPDSQLDGPTLVLPGELTTGDAP